MWGDTKKIRQFSSVQSLGCVRLSATPWTTAHQASLSITNSWSLLKLMSIESVMPFNHLILCHPLLLVPLIFPSIRVSSNELALCIRWPKYWSFSFNISPSHEHPGLISSRLDWLDLLAIQGILKSLLHHHSSKASILWLSFLYSPTLTSIHDYWKNHSLDYILVEWIKITFWRKYSGFFFYPQEEKLLFLSWMCSFGRLWNKHW